MNTKILFMRSSPVRTILVDEATGRELYRIETPRLVLAGSVTKVFRCDPATAPTSNLLSDHSGDAGEPRESHSSEDWNPLPGAKPDDHDAENDNEDDAAEELPLVKNEIARWYWKWFSSPRLVFEGKISTRAQYMPFKTKMRASYVFNHNGVAYRWTLPLDNLRCPRLVFDSNNDFIAEYYPNLFKKGKAYFEVTPAGMAILDHIVVTFIPVEVNRRRG